MKAQGKQREGPSWTTLAVVMAAAFLAFLPALRNGFVDWDDALFIVKNPNYQGFDLARLRWMFTDTRAGIYHPLTWLSYALDYHLWGLSPMGFHFTNLVLHSLNAALFYQVSRRLLILGSQREAAGLGVAAAVSALFFAMHPLRVESVAWTIARKDVLSGLFFLLSVLLYLRAQAESSRRCLWGSIVTFALALLSKPSVVPLPLALLVLDFYPLRRLSARSWPLKVLIEKIPYLILSLAAGMVALMARPRGLLQTPDGLNLAAWGAHTSFGLAFYAWKTLVPLHLRPLYEASASLNPGEWRFLISGAAVGGAAVLLFVMRRRWQWLLAASAFYAVMLTPTLGALAFKLPLADRYTYLPCLGWAVLMGAAVLQNYNRFTVRAAAAALVLLGFLTWQQTLVWRDTYSLWTHALSLDPKISVGHHSLGNYMISRDRIDQALPHYREALRLNPGYALAHNSLGLALARKGQHEEAVRHYLKAAELRQDYWEPYNNLGLSCAHLGKADEAIRHFQNALRLNPDKAEIHSNFGLALATLGRREEAIQELTLALRMNPAQPKVVALFRYLLSRPSRPRKPGAH